MSRIEIETFETLPEDCEICPNGACEMRLSEAGFIVPLATDGDDHFYTFCVECMQRVMNTIQSLARENEAMRRARGLHAT